MSEDVTQGSEAAEENVISEAVTPTEGTSEAESVEAQADAMLAEETTQTLTAQEVEQEKHKVASEVGRKYKAENEALKQELEELKRSQAEPKEQKQVEEVVVKRS